jgi:hypothetical protein
MTSAKSWKVLAKSIALLLVIAINRTWPAHLDGAEVESFSIDSLRWQLGIVNAENDAVYLPLRKGRNELVLAVSELTGG